MRVVRNMLPLATVIGLGLLGSCASSRAALVTPSVQQSATGNTVGGVGRLPGPLSSTIPVTRPATTLSPPSDSIPATTVAEPIGAKASGNRLLVIGDSIMASVSQRYGGEACAALVPQGWHVEVDAETGRFIDFGQKVLSKRLDAGWDAAIVLLGNNYDSNAPDVYQSALHKLLVQLAPRPVGLLTTMLFRPAQIQVNAVIRSEAALFDNVTVVEWADVTEPSFTGNDNLHLTDSGRAALGLTLALAMGQAPSTQGSSIQGSGTQGSSTQGSGTQGSSTRGAGTPGVGTQGECLKTSFRDDSAGSPSGPAGNTKKKKTSTGSASTPTTVKAVGSAATTTTPSQTGSPSATTVPRPGPATTVPGGTTASTTPPQPTSPAQTSPAATTPPATSPPATSPPATTPPVTSPPPLTT